MYIYTFSFVLPSIQSRTSRTYLGGGHLPDSYLSSTTGTGPRQQNTDSSLLIFLTTPPLAASPSHGITISCGETPAEAPEGPCGLWASVSSCFSCLLSSSVLLLRLPSWNLLLRETLSALLDQMKISVASLSFISSTLFQFVCCWASFLLRALPSLPTV